MNMEGGGVYSGGGDLGLTLGDIGKSSEAGPLLPIGNAAFFTVMLSVILTRLANVGGLSLNKLYDEYGLELLASKTAAIVLVIQFARFLYTSVWGAYGKRWSPLVFVAILLVTQAVACLGAYYAVIQPLPPGKNDFIDRLKSYAKEASRWSMAYHAALYTAVAFVAMLLCDSSDLVQALLPVTLVALVPTVLSISYTKPAPPPPPPKKKEEMRDMREMQEIRGFY